MLPKTQGTYFKISALYFKIYALYFSPKITSDFQQLTKTLKKHDKRIKVIGWSAEYYGVAVRFDFEEPLVKTAIAAIHRDSILEDLKGLLLKVTEDVNESYLQNRIGDAINTINKESQLDFVVEDALTEYMKLHFSIYSFDILDGEDFDKSIVSIALGY